MSMMRDGKMVLYFDEAEVKDIAEGAVSKAVNDDLDTIDAVQQAIDEYKDGGE